MRPALHAELLKLRTTRTPWLVGATLIAFAAVGPPLNLLIDTARRTSVLTDAAAQLDVLTLAPITLFATVIGALVATGDHRHGTVGPTLLAVPSRHRLLLAKVIVTTVIAGALALAALGVLGLLTAGLLATQDAGWLIPATWLPAHALRSGLPIVMMALVGLGIGELVRNQTVAVAGPLVLSTVATPMITALAPDISWYLPAGLDAVLQHGGASAPFGRLTAATLLALYAATLVTGATLRSARRDIG
jgi:ABC-2 type transport system permease protein